MENKIRLFLVLILINSCAYSEQYAIQVDKKNTNAVSQEYMDVLRIYGDVYTVTTQKSHSNTYLGPYHTKTSAVEALNELRVAGFNEASVVLYENSQLNSDDIRYQPENQDINISTLLDNHSLNQWNKLGEAEKESIEYVNGTLQIEINNQLIPLDQYLADK